MCRDIIPITENRMGNKMDNEMESVVTLGGQLTICSKDNYPYCGPIFLANFNIGYLN